MKFHRMPPKSCSLCGRASLLQVWGYSLEDLKVAHIQVGWLRQSSVSQVGFVQRYIYIHFEISLCHIRCRNPTVNPLYITYTIDRYVHTPLSPSSYMNIMNLMACLPPFECRLADPQWWGPLPSTYNYRLDGFWTREWYGSALEAEGNTDLSHYSWY